MKIVVGLLVSMSVLLTGCGGGGGGGGGGGNKGGYGVGENITYLNYGGLRWSSPSNATYKYLASTVNLIGIENAQSYCSYDLSTNGGPALPLNFNREVGWRIPTESEIRALEKAIASPPNWSAVDIWVQPDPSDRWPKVYGQYYLFGSGGSMARGLDDAITAHVVCVK